MHYYDENKHRAGDRRAAALATAAYAAAVLLVFFLVKIRPSDALSDPQPNLILMDFGESYIPTPNTAANRRPETADIHEPEETVAPENTSIDEGLIADEKKADTVQAAPPRQINTNALYSRNTASISKADSKDDVVSSAMEGGSPQGAVGSTGTENSGTFSLEGRTLVGRLVEPPYGKNAEGRIVIEIRVDREGKVTDASYSPQNSTISDAQMIEAARQAALQTRFSRNTNALFVQTGSITYNFKLR